VPTSRPIKCTVFLAFQRMSDDRTKLGAGIGLGLSIVGAIANAPGGRGHCRGSSREAASHVVGVRTGGAWSGASPRGNQ
jgi:signal transduction histidine kinase